MKDLKRLLAKPTHLSLVMLSLLIILSMSLAVQTFPRFGKLAPADFPWFSFGIVALFILGSGIFLVLKGFVWMNREYPSTMYEADMARRTAVRRADTRSGRWLASARNTMLPRILIAAGWAALLVLAALIALSYLGVLS